MLKLTWFLMFVEPLGAIALISGFPTRWASLGLGIIMVGAIIILRNMGASVFSSQALGVDYNSLILAGCLVLMAFGPGKWLINHEKIHSWKLSRLPQG